LVSGHVFVDETKERGYFVAAAVLLPGDVTRARQEIRGLILPRQRRIHFHKENTPRRNRILAVVAQLDVNVTIYDASTHTSVKTARDACLIQLIADSAKSEAERLVLELDDSSVRSDQKILYEQVRAAGAVGRLRYDHMRAHEECLLTIPDTVAWCWAKGGVWRAKIQPLITDVHRV
jgi:hypothetical protein